MVRVSRPKEIPREQIELQNVHVYEPLRSTLANAAPNSSRLAIEGDQ
jgi:hypothetical protein